MKLAVVTKIPSPYQVELFDGIADVAGVDFTAIYLKKEDADRHWQPRQLNHRAVFLTQDKALANTRIQSADLAVFAWYRDAFVAKLISDRSHSAQPWVFWGERPGFSRLGFLGALYRRRKLKSIVNDTRVAIWGIGEWAIEGYRKEFGSKRRYFHMPYVSNLSSFLSLPSRDTTKTRINILFSGSLIERKGLHELSVAFERLSQRRQNAHLTIMGAGPLELELRGRFQDHPRVRFLGFQDWGKLIVGYKEAHLLCAPSHYDGWGLIVPEAMAAGIPIVASTSVGAAREMVVPGDTGWLVPPRDAVALEKALDTALDCIPESHERMRNECRRIAANYDIAHGVSRFVTAARACIEAWGIEEGKVHA